MNLQQPSPDRFGDAETLKSLSNTLPPECWYAPGQVSNIEVDCIIALMLKIMDGKCKMPAGEKQLLVRLYDTMGERPGAQLGTHEHLLIRQARAKPSEALRLDIYERRVLAETRISRPVMKTFKARLREEGLLPIAI